MGGPVAPLVTPDELAETLVGERAPYLLDVRWVLGQGAEGNREDYLAGHLPGAVFLDLESVLSDPLREDRVGGRHPMPSCERVQHGLRSAGLRQGADVVVYDAARSLGAARAWWVLRHYGVASRVLDGGLAAWAEAGHPVQTGEVEVSPGDVKLTDGRGGLLDASGILAFQQVGGQVLDARPADRFRGENETMDPVAGHIPGALNLPALSLVPEGPFVDEVELRRLAEEAGVDLARPTALYCGSGVQAAHLALAIEGRVPGAPTPAVYVGSFSDWVSGPERPVETGPARREPTIADRGRRS